MKVVKLKKELAEFLENDWILLYDSIEEAMILYKEKAFVKERKIKILEDEVIITRRKYLFIISGNEKCSIISKFELQELLKKVRTEEVNLQVILTNIDNLTEIGSLGFREIKIV